MNMSRMRSGEAVVMAALVAKVCPPQSGSPPPLLPAHRKSYSRGINMPQPVVNQGFFNEWRRAYIFTSSPKRQRTAALQDASRRPWAIGERGSVLECGGPPPLFPRACQIVFAWFAWFAFQNAVSKFLQIICSVSSVGGRELLNGCFMGKIGWWAVVSA